MAIQTCSVSFSFIKYRYFFQNGDLKCQKLKKAASNPSNLLTMTAYPTPG